MVDQDLQEVEMEIEVEEEEIKCSVFDNDPLALRWRVFLYPEILFRGRANLKWKVVSRHLPEINFGVHLHPCKHQS